MRSFRVAMMLRVTLTAASATILFDNSTLPAQQQRGGVHPEPAPVVTAVPLTSAVNIDGKLDEEVWKTAVPATQFRQSQPDEGKPATQKTEVRFAYDDNALYVGARMYDDHGAKGVHTRLIRRDQMSESDGDILRIDIDSYHSHNASYFMWVNPSGSKRDGTGDPTWDPVWETKANIDSLGWTAEMRIPFSQLNFGRATDQTWGINIQRFIHRLNERDHFAWWPNNDVGGPQRYGHLEGLKISNRPKGVELMPYVVGRGRYIRPADPNNPFTKTSDKDYRLGGDVKARITSNLTLNAAINPDFGQVEVDPAVVNLSAFETFFQERRPFFIENQDAFGFGSFSCFFCSNVSNLQMFYSRRLGRSPQIFPSGTYVDQPENATILAAGKVTGRTASNYQLGVLDAVTRKEKADVITLVGGDARTESRTEVEPLTNYFVLRPRKEFQGGAYSVGAIATSVDRFSDDSLIDARLPSNARSGGIDWFTSWKNRTYDFFGQIAGSDVRGSELAIQRLQRSSARYYQRPDRDRVKFDPNATSLHGYGGYARIAKDGGVWLWESMVNYRSPGFEVNDISFLSKADYVWMNANVARSITKPGPVFRNYFAVLAAQQEYNYDGDRTDREFSVGLFTTLRNFWGFSAFTIRTPEIFDDRATRGGPVVKRFGYRYYSTTISTDARRKLSFSFSPNYTAREKYADSYNLNLTATLKPSSNIQISLGPSYSKSWSVAQFVTSGPDSTNIAFFGRRYIFAGLQQKSLSMSTRVNVTFTPELTLEGYAQPLIAAGDYQRFREFIAPRQSAIRDFTPSQISSEDVGGSTRYTVDVDGSGPAQPISFFDPNFNFRSLRGNAVLRWEYRPGSTLYFVWQQNRAESVPLGNFDFSRDRDALFNAHPDNIFLVKATYWVAF